jgi:transposase
MRRTGVSVELGTALVKQQKKLFELWHRVRDGTLSRSDIKSA